MKHNANTYPGHIHHGEGGWRAPMSASADKTSRVRGKPESGKSPKAVDRTSGHPSSGEPTPRMKTKKASGQ